MDKETLEAFGFTREEIERKVIDRIVTDLMRSIYIDDEDGEHVHRSEFADRMANAVKESVDKAVAAIAEKHVLPNIGQYVERVTFQETNKWGEPKKEAMTFTEYLAKKAEDYLTERVDYKGKTQGEDSFGWRGEQTRVTYLVHRHLQYTIESVMKEAVKNANDKLVAGIEETVKLKLKTIADSLKVGVSI